MNLNEITRVRGGVGLGLVVLRLVVLGLIVLRLIVLGLIVLWLIILVVVGTGVVVRASFVDLRLLHQ